MLFGLLLFAYLPALQGGILWDDDAHITRPALQSFSGLFAIWFKPGSRSNTIRCSTPPSGSSTGSGAIRRRLPPLNVLLHALAAFLLVAMLRPWPSPAAWLAAFLFALHPVQVESVAWISEQKNTLSTVFYLASALVYLRFDQTRRRQHYFIALGLFLAALASKSVTATLPAALLVVFWWLRGRLDWKRDIVPLLPWLALGALRE